MNASKQALIRHLILSRNFGNFLVSIAFIRVDGFLDSEFNFMRRLMNHIGWFNAIMKMMGVKFHVIMDAVKISVPVWRTHTEKHVLFL